MQFLRKESSSMSSSSRSLTQRVVFTNSQVNKFSDVVAFEKKAAIFIEKYIADSFVVDEVRDLSMYLGTWKTTSTRPTAGSTFSPYATRSRLSAVFGLEYQTYFHLCCKCWEAGVRYRSFTKSISEILRLQMKTREEGDFALLICFLFCTIVLLYSKLRKFARAMACHRHTSASELLPAQYRLLHTYCKSRLSHKLIH